MRCTAVDILVPAQQGECPRGLEATFQGDKQIFKWLGRSPQENCSQVPTRLSFHGFPAAAALGDGVMHTCPCGAHPCHPLAHTGTAVEGLTHQVECTRQSAATRLPLGLVLRHHWQATQCYYSSSFLTNVFMKVFIIYL